MVAVVARLSVLLLLVSLVLSVFVVHSLLLLLVFLLFLWLLLGRLFLLLSGDSSGGGRLDPLPFVVLSLLSVVVSLLAVVSPICTSCRFVGVSRNRSVFDDFKSFFNVPVRLFLMAVTVAFLHSFVVARLFLSQLFSMSYTAAVALIVCFLIRLFRVAIAHLDCIIVACNRTSNPKDRSQATAVRSFATAHARSHVSFVGIGRFKLPILTLELLRVLLDWSLMMLGILRFLESCSSMSDCESNSPQ